MKRSAFVTLAAAGAAGVPLFSLAGQLEGSSTTQPALFAALPRIRPAQWTRIILGSGAQYQKQIGAGTERDASNKRLFLETQVGSPGGDCNPNSMRKAYLRGGRFGSLFDRYEIVTNVGLTENFFFRFGDLHDGVRPNAADNTLRLLDVGDLYDPRPMRIISVGPQTVHAANRTLEATHIVADFAAPRLATRGLRRIELWHHPTFPFGVVRYRATLVGLEPFEAHVYSFGNHFTTLLPLSLARVRTMTPDGQYGQLIKSIGA